MWGCWLLVGEWDRAFPPLQEVPLHSAEAGPEGSWLLWDAQEWGLEWQELWSLVSPNDHLKLSFKVM